MVLVMLAQQLWLQRSVERKQNIQSCGVVVVVEIFGGLHPVLLCDRPTLSNIHLLKNEISDAGAMALATTLEKDDHVIELNLRSVSSIDGIAAVAFQLSGCGSQVQ